MKPYAICMVCSDVDESVAKTKKGAYSWGERAQEAEKGRDAKEDGDSSKGLCKAQSGWCGDGEEPSQDRHEGRYGCLSRLMVVTALFNAISRGKRLLPSIQKENEGKKSSVPSGLLRVEKDRVDVIETFNEKIEDSKQRLVESQKNEKKWSVLDDHMVEKGADMLNWDTKEENADDWDEDIDL